MSDGLVLDELAARYEDFSANYSLRLPAGSFCALIGPSGGGKTTALHLIAGFEPTTGGTLSFAGRDMLALRPALRPLTLLFQDHNLFAHMSAADNVGIGIDPGLRLTEGQRMRVQDALSRVGLRGKDKRLPADLSGGERQRVALARALVRARPLLLLDEPFGGLDPGLRLDMLGLVDEMRREAGWTVLMSLHTPQDVIGVAETCAFVDSGGIVMQASPADVLGSNDPRVAAYLGASPSRAGRPPLT